MKIPKTYGKCHDPNICSELEPGDIIYGERYNSKKELVTCKYHIHHMPVFFELSGNWTLRVHTKSLNQDIGKDENFQLTEHIYLNDKSIHKYRFKKTLIQFYEHQKRTRASAQSKAENAGNKVN